MGIRREDRHHFGFGLFHQILLAIGVVALIPSAGLWYVGVYGIEQELTASATRNLIANAEAIALDVDQWVVMNRRILHQNAETPAIRSMDAATQDQVLKTITDSYGWIYLAVTLLPNGQNLGRSDGKAANYYGDRTYFRQVMAGAPLATEVVLGKSSSRPAYVLAEPIKDAAGRTLGVIAVATALADLSETVTAARIGRTGYAMLLDEEGRLLARGGGSVPPNLADLSGHPRLAQVTRAKELISVRDEWGRQVLAYLLVLDQGWKLIVQQDVDEIQTRVHQAQQTALLVLASSLVASVALALLLARRLSAPLRRLAIVADEISHGNLDAAIVEQGRRDETGALARAVERMRVSLCMAFTRLRQR